MALYLGKSIIYKVNLILFIINKFIVLYLLDALAKMTRIIV